jgi:hypothetical protein
MPRKLGLVATYIWANEGNFNSLCIRGDWLPFDVLRANPR